MQIWDTTNLSIPAADDEDLEISFDSETEQEQEQEIPQQKTDLTVILSKHFNMENIVKPYDISTADKQFYLRYNEFMDSPDYALRDKEKYEIRMNEFLTKRLNHICRMAGSTSLDARKEEKLTYEEIILYKQINELVTDFKKNIKKIA